MTAVCLGVTIVFGIVGIYLVLRDAQERARQKGLDDLVFGEWLRENDRLVAIAENTTSEVGKKMAWDAVETHVDTGAYEYWNKINGTELK